MKNEKKLDNSEEEKKEKRKKVTFQNVALCYIQYSVSPPIVLPLPLSLTHTDTSTYTLFILYLEEKPRCLNSFGIKFERNKSADLPLRQYMSYREHWAIKPGGQKHCWEITHGGLWFGLGLTRGKGEEGRGGYSICICKAQKRDSHIRGEAFLSVCKQFVVHTEDKIIPTSPFPLCHPIPFHPPCHPALLSLGPLTLPSVIKRFMIWAQRGSLPTPACCDSSSLPPRTCLSEAGSIGKDSAHKAEVTGRDCEKGERDLWRIQFKTSLRLWLS